MIKSVKQRISEKEYNGIFNALEGKGLVKNKNEMLAFLVKAFIKSQAERAASLDVLLDKETGENLDEAVKYGNFTRKEIINAGINHRSNYIKTAASSIEKGGNAIGVAGTAWSNIDKFVSDLMAANAANPQSQRIAITQSVIRKGGGKDGFEVKGIKSNIKATRSYLVQNEERIIKHNVEMGVIGDIIKYVSKKDGKRQHMIDIAQKYGYVEF